MVHLRTPKTGSRRVRKDVSESEELQLILESASFYQQAQAPTMKLLSQVLVMVALLASSAAALEGRTTTQDEEPTILSETFGGPHGDMFTDTIFASAGQTVHSITIRTGERVNGVGIDVTDHWGHKHTQYHGGNGGSAQTLALKRDERFTCLEAHWGAYHGHTRIRYIKITTSMGRSLTGGTPTDRKGTVCAPNGFQLGGFIGHSGVELDQVGAIWTNNRVLE